MDSLVDKNLVVLFKLNDATFSNGTDTKICEGLRMIVNVDGNPPPDGFSANMTIFGMNEHDMKLIASISRILAQSIDIQIYASDSKNAQMAIFSGLIFDARITYNNMPNVGLYVSAFAANRLKLIQYPPVSYKEVVKAQDVLEGIAKFAGLDFENQGINEVIVNCYLTDSVATNIDIICKNKNIRYSIENNKLTIWKDKRKAPIPLINVENGLVSYPDPGVTGIYFTCRYNSNIRFGSLVDIKSSSTQCNGRFHVLSLNHNLSYELPGGPWFTTVQAYPTADIMSMGVK